MSPRPAKVGQGQSAAATTVPLLDHDDYTNEGHWSDTPKKSDQGQQLGWQPILFFMCHLRKFTQKATELTWPLT